MPFLENFVERLGICREGVGRARAEPLAHVVEVRVVREAERQQQRRAHTHRLCAPVRAASDRADERRLVHRKHALLLSESAAVRRPVAVCTHRSDTPTRARRIAACSLPATTELAAVCSA